MQQLVRRLRDAWAWASKLAYQKSEKRVHLARLHAACMAACPFRPLVWAKVWNRIFVQKLFKLCKSIFIGTVPGDKLPFIKTHTVVQ